MVVVIDARPCCPCVVIVAAVRVGVVGVATAVVAPLPLRDTAAFRGRTSPQSAGMIGLD